MFKVQLIYTRQDKFNVPVYDQLFHMGLNDCLQLLIQSVGGFCVLMQYELPDYVNKILGGLNNSLLFSWVAFSYSISLNRFLAFCYPHLYDNAYSKRLLRVSY
uniref:7TM_GPCR_Srx domain-containing protein n=1 Tax=Panagrellus redivivus TaxID=6233 RepID=A0A7E4ZTZ3_PANRE